MPLQQQYGETKALPGTEAWRLAHPLTISGGVLPPSGTPTLTQNQNPNPIAPTINPSVAATGTSPNTKVLGGTSYTAPQPQIPTLQPPVGIPQTGSGGGGGGTAGQLKIELPDAFKANQAISGPNIFPTTTIRGGITMPAVTPGVKPQTFPSMNWSDFLTIAHSR